MGSCHCCQQPSVDVALATEARSVSLSKCGEIQFGDPVAVPAYYKTVSYSREDEFEPCSATWTYGRDAAGVCAIVSDSQEPTDCADGVDIRAGEGVCPTTPTSITCEITTVTLSNEDATGDMVAAAESALASATWGSGSSASRDLSASEEGITLREMRYKIRHKPSPTCYLKIWLRATTTNEAEETTTVDLEPYEWIGTGSPCFGTAAHAGGWIETDWLGTVAPPEANGLTSVSIVKISLLLDFTPEDGNLTGLPPEA